MRVRTFPARPATVAELMRPGVPAVEPGDCLADVAKQMRRDRVGAVVVLRRARLAGIITERDLMHAVADGIDPRTSPASERMTPAPRTIARDEPASRAADLMIEHGIRHLPVVENGTVVGVISARDLLHLRRRVPLELLAHEPW